MHPRLFPVFYTNTWILFNLNLYVAKSFRFMFRLPFVEDDEKGLMDNECEVASDIHGKYVNL